MEVTELNNEPVVNNENQEDLTIENIINNVSPIPLSSILGKRPNNNNRSTGSQVLTKSPLINEFKEKQRVKDTIERKKLERKAKRQLHFVAPKKSNNENNDDADKDDEEEVMDGDDSDDDAACLYCNDLFSRSKARERWIQCYVCKKWSHAECAGVTITKQKFKCELCN